MLKYFNHSRVDAVIHAWMHSNKVNKDISNSMIVVAVNWMHICSCIFVLWWIERRERALSSSTPASQYIVVIASHIIRNIICHCQVLCSVNRHTTKNTLINWWMSEVAIVTSIGAQNVKVDGIPSKNISLLAHTKQLYTFHVSLFTTIENDKTSSVSCKAFVLTRIRIGWFGILPFWYGDTVIVRDNRPTLPR